MTNRSRGSGPASGFEGKSLYLLLALAVVVADQWSKWLVETRLVRYQIETVIPGLLNFTHVRNTGVAFGLFATGGHRLGTLLLTLLGAAALSVVLVYFWRTPADDRLLLASLGLILGGAIGNLTDRLAAGEVTDFIDFYFGSYHWHTFNLADSAITIGIVLMGLDIWRGGREPDSPEAKP